MKTIERPHDLMPRYYLLVIGVIAVFLLYSPAVQHRALFESVVSEFTIVMAGFLFILSVITYRYSKDGYLLFVGFAFLFNALFELFFFLVGAHPATLTARVIGLAEPLRVTGRILLGIGLMAVPFLAKRETRQKIALAIYIAVTMVLTWSVCNMGFLHALTARKISVVPMIYENGVIILLGGALFTHYWQRKHLHRSLYLTMSAGIIFLILMELERMLNTGSLNGPAYGGGLCRVLAYLMAFRGIEMVSIEIPYEVIFKELKDSATLDPLTGLLNRKGLNDVIQKELAYRPEADSVGVLLMDLDGFKMVNDRYGHSMGDYLLVEFAKVLKSCLRGTDVLCRLGGDEFLVVVKAGQVELNMVRQRIQDAVARWRERDKMAHQIGVSIGSSTWNLQKTRDVSQLITEADQDMYWEKKKRKLLEKSGKRPD